MPNVHQKPEWKDPYWLTAFHKPSITISGIMCHVSASRFFVMADALDITSHSA